MTYREDDDALRGRVDALEAELAAAKGEIATLRGEVVATGASAQTEHSRVLGAPSRWSRVAVLPYEIDERGYEAIAKVLHMRLGMNASQVGRTLSVPGLFTLTHESGQTRIEMQADWRGNRGAIWAVGSMSTFFGGTLAAGLLADTLVAHGAASELGLIGLTAVVVLGVSSSAAALMRRQVGGAVRTRIAACEGTFAAILALSEEHRVVTRARVAPEDENEDEDENEAELARQKRA